MTNNYILCKLDAFRKNAFVVNFSLSYQAAQKIRAYQTKEERLECPEIRFFQFLLRTSQPQPLPESKLPQPQSCQP
jgi:hypothetical protein